jgi:hypothetical protein
MQNTAHYRLHVTDRYWPVDIGNQTRSSSLALVTRNVVSRVNDTLM